MLFEKNNGLYTHLRGCYSVKKLAFCLILICTFIFPTTFGNAMELEKNIFYVSENGNDSNDGTIGAPWKTIQKAADTLAPGETVYVREGKYPEFVRIKNSGSKDKGYISFKAFPGEQPVLEGKNLKLSSGKRALFSLENASYIVVHGFELRNLSTSDSDRYPAGIVVSDGGSNIKLTSNNIHHIKNSSSKGNAHGIIIYGNTLEKMSNITIEKNNIHHLTLGSSESLTLNGNIDGFTISQNKIHHNNNIGIDVAGFYGACKISNCVNQVRNGTIANNKVYNNSSGKNPAYEGDKSAAGIYADGSTKIVIEKNLVYNNDYGISVASEQNRKEASYITVDNNIIYNNTNSGIVLGGSSSSNGGASNNTVTNNVFKYNDQSGEGFGEITIQSNTSDNLFMNNIIYTNKKKNIFQNEKKEKSNIFKNNYIYSSEEEISLLERIITKKILTK